MGNLIMKVIGYIFLRYFVFLGALYSISKDAKGVKWSDLRNGEDWFYFSWLFLIPVVVEIVLLGLPISYGLDKVASSTNKVAFYFLFVGLFVVEFFISNWMYGMSSSFYKVGISIVLFLMFFWRKLF